MLKSQKGRLSIKKTLFPIAMGAVMFSSALLSVGCMGGEPKDAKWYSGTANIDTVTGGNVGDFYLDTDDFKIYQKKSDGNWVIVMENFAPDQSAGETYTYMAFASDSNGTDFSTTYKNGLNYIGILTSDTEVSVLTKDKFQGKWTKFADEQGLTPYVGYDGYFWYGTERSEHKATDVYSATVADNTIGLIGNEYFSSYTISAGTPVALMNSYFATIKKTGYSGVAVSQIDVYAQNAGTLTISTANVSSVVARSGQNSVALSKVTQKTLNEGFNTIKFDTPFTVGANATLVLGASGDTASLVAYKGLGYEQSQGSFANLNKSASANVIEATDGVNDKVAVKVQTNNVKNTEFIDGFGAKVMDNANGWTDVVRAYTPLMYKNKTIFEGSTVNYISAMTTSVSAIDENQFVTVKVVDVANSGLTVRGTYQFKAKIVDLGASTSVNRVINYYPDQPIKINQGQSLAFYTADDPVQLKFKKGSGAGDATLESMGAGFYYNDWNSANLVASNENVGINVNVSKTVGANWAQNVESLTAQENVAYQTAAKQALKTQLTGKKFSILGDSISSFNGYCNDTANNTTIGNNAYWTFNFSNVNDTWWKQTIDAFGMQLLVNNAWSGSTISDARAPGAWQTRCENLHDNTLSNNPGGVAINPDVIAFYMGINDLYMNYAVQTVDSNYNWSQFGNGFIPDTFDEAYAYAIYKMQNKYPNAKIFCFTIPKSSQGDGVGDNLLKYNDAIKNIAAHFGCEVVDLYSTVLSDCYASSLYTMDNLHPNANGMDVMTREFAKALAKVYLPA